jgi:hypothetical protein
MIKILLIIIAIMCTIFSLCFYIWGVVKKEQTVAVIYGGLQSIINIAALVMLLI